jgi:hypothetical protein
MPLTLFATGKAIDLSALRAFDATLNLETSAVAVASVKVTYADLEASLKNGVFKIAKLTGQFYGGAVDFKGTIDSTKGRSTSIWGQPAGHLSRRDAARHHRHQQLRQPAPDGGDRRQDQCHGHPLRDGHAPEEIRNSLMAGQGDRLSLSGRSGARWASPLRHRRQHFQHGNGFDLGGAGGLHQSPDTVPATCSCRVVSLKTTRSRA